MNRGQLVSVIITTKNEERVIGRLVRSIKNQTYEAIELILVDNYSIDKTSEIAKKIGVKVYSYGPERSAQRNFGAKRGNGKYYFFLDADMELTKDVVKECVEVIESNSKIGAISIPEKSIANTFWEKVKAFERSFYNLKGDPATDAARFFSKNAFEKCGGYDTNITGPEDWDLRDTILKSGYKIARVNALIYHYERIKSLVDLLRKKFYYGLKSHRYLSKQKVSLIGAETIYFFRPVFYKNWKKLLTHPILTFAMILMLTLEFFAGGLGYLIGRKEK